MLCGRGRFLGTITARIPSAIGFGYEHLLFVDWIGAEELRYARCRGSNGS